MSETVDIGAAVLRKKMVPWFIVAALIAVLGTGGSGLYFGYKSGFESASLAFKDDQLALVSAQRDALNEKEARRLEAEQRAVMVEKNFLTALNNIQVINRTYNNEVVREIKQQVYIDCQLPPSGREIIRQKAKEINAQLQRDANVSLQRKEQVQ